MADVIIKKPWGQEVLHSTSPMNVKTIIVEMGNRSSKHYHRDRTEVLICTSGEGTIQTYDRNGNPHVTKTMVPGAWVIIQPNQLHRIEASYNTKDGLTLLETSIGSLTDVIRMEDDYGRITCQCEAYDGIEDDLCEACSSARAHSKQCTNCKQ